MNRKLWVRALLGTWKGFPSAKAERCVKGRHYKGIRSECTSAAERAAERYMKVQWSWTLSVSTCASSLGWGTDKPRGTQSWKRESRAPWLCKVFSVPSGARPRADQPLQLLGLRKAGTREVSLTVTKSSGEGLEPSAHDLF